MKLDDLMTRSPRGMSLDQDFARSLKRERIVAASATTKQTLAAVALTKTPMTKTITRPQAYVFAIAVGWMRFYWTGRYDRVGQLERSTHRADAIKFPDQATALAVAETHNELRDSSTWKIAPLVEGRRW